jgi:hypothetical protein
MPFTLFSTPLECYSYLRGGGILVQLRRKGVGMKQNKVERVCETVKIDDDKPPINQPVFDLTEPKHYLNGELTWLEFNRCVLTKAGDKRNPLLERLVFWKGLGYM